MPIENPYAKRLPSDRIGRIRTSTRTGSSGSSASASADSSGSCRTPHPAAAATTNAAATTATTTAATTASAAASASSGHAAAPTAQAQQLPAAPPPQQQQPLSIPYHARLPSRRVSFAAAEVATVSELARWLPSLPVHVDRGSAGEDANTGSSTAAIAKKTQRSVRFTGVVLHVDLPGRFVLVGDGAAGARPSSWGGASAVASSRGRGSIGAGAGAGRGGVVGRGLGRGRGLGGGVGIGIGIGKGSGSSSTAQKTPLNRYARTSMGGSIGRGVGRGVGRGSAGRGLHVRGNRGRTSLVGGGSGGMGGSIGGNSNHNHNHNHNHNGLLNTAKKRKLVYTGGKKSAAAATAAAAITASTAATTAMGSGTGTGAGTMGGTMATPRQGGLPSSSRRSFPGAATGTAIGRGLLRTPRTTTGGMGIGGSNGNPKRPRPSSTTPAPPGGAAAAALEVLRQQRMRGGTTTQAIVAVDIASLMPLEANVGWTVGDTVTVFGEVRRMVADAATTTTAPVPPVPAAKGSTSARTAALPANSGTADAPAEASTEVTTERPSAPPPPSALHLVLSALETNGRGVTARIIRNTNGTDVHLLAEALRLRRKHVRDRCASWPPAGRTSMTTLVGVPGMGVEALMTGKIHNVPNDEVKKDGMSGE